MAHTTPDPRGHQVDDKARDPLLEEAEEIYEAYGNRRAADDEVETVFRDGRFIGKLYKSLGINIKDQSTPYLLVNFLRAQVTDRAVMLNMMPDPKWDVPFTVDPDVALTEQDILINLNHTLWDFWRVKRAYKTHGFNLALKNRALWYLHPDFDNKKPMLYSLNPSSFYAEPDYRGDYPRVFLIDDIEGRRLLAQYPGAERFGVTSYIDEYQVVEFWDKKIRRRFINGLEDESASIEHNMGFVPIRYTQDVHLPGSMDNMGNAWHGIGMAENFTDVLVLASAEMRKKITATPIIKGEYNSDEVKAAMDGKMALGLEKDGSFEYVQPIQGQLGVQQHLQSLDDLYRVITNWPRLRSGQIKSSIWTERGINAAQGAVSDDILTVRESMARDLEWLDEAAVYMMQKMWGNVDQPLIMYENEKIKGSVTIRPKQDIPADFRHELVVFPLAHDTQGKSVVLMQLFGQKIIDLRTVLENLPGMNPAEVMRRLKEDVERDIETQAMLQKQMFDLQQQQAGGLEQGTEALNQGAIPGGAENPLEAAAGAAAGLGV